MRSALRFPFRFRHRVRFHTRFRYRIRFYLYCWLLVLVLVMSTGTDTMDQKPENAQASGTANTEHGKGQSSTETKSQTEPDLSQEELNKMIKYINSRSDYKVVTSIEYDLLHADTSTPSVQKGAKSRVTDVKFEFPKPALSTLLPQTSMNTSSIQQSVATVHLPKIPPFSGEDKSGEVKFDVWRYEVKCIIREANYPEPVILQAIRNSLRGKARSLLITLPPHASPNNILEKLEGVYGNVSAHESLMETFYKMKQEPNESLAEFGMRLENVLQIPFERNKISGSARNEMLCSKFFSGLREPMLQNAVRYKYDTIKDFDRFRKEVRSVELEMTTSNQTYSASSTKAIGHTNKVQATHMHSASTLEDIVKKLDRLSTKVDNFETELTSLKQASRGQNSSRGMNNFRGYGRTNYSGSNGPNQGFANRGHEGQTYPFRGLNRGFRNFRGQGLRGGMRGHLNH